MGKEEEEERGGRGRLYIQNLHPGSERAGRGILILASVCMYVHLRVCMMCLCLRRLILGLLMSVRHVSRVGASAFGKEQAGHDKGQTGTLARTRRVKMTGILAGGEKGRATRLQLEQGKAN